MCVFVIEREIEDRYNLVEFDVWIAWKVTMCNSLFIYCFFIDKQFIYIVVLLDFEEFFHPKYGHYSIVFSKLKIKVK